MQDRKPHLYLMPGLGVDDRIFGRLIFPFPVTRLNWLAPSSQEPWDDYVRRMKVLIKHPNPILVGVSHGGMLVQDLARLLPVSGLILISTLSHQDLLPPMLRLNRYVPFYRLLQGSWRVRTLPVWGPRVGISDQEEQRLLMDMFRKQDDAYRLWAMKALLSWQGDDPKVPCLRLHGTHDHVFPRRYIQREDVHWIQGGNHFMIYQHATEIQAHIRRWLGLIGAYGLHST